MKNNIGEIIRKIREAKSIKQEELANYLQIKQSTLSKMENGKHNVSIELVINVVNYTETSIQTFFPDELYNLEKINLNYQIEELHDELKVQKENNKQLIKMINSLEQHVEDKISPQPETE